MDAGAGAVGGAGRKWGTIGEVLGLMGRRGGIARDVRPNPHANPTYVERVIGPLSSAYNSRAFIRLGVGGARRCDGLLRANLLKLDLERIALTRHAGASECHGRWKE